MTATAGICIVGTGHAGSELAFSLRQQGWEGRITLIGEEPHLPYQRPPLSKAFLKGEVVPESLYLRPPASYEQANIELQLGQRVAQVDRERKVLVFADGSERAYEKLALATGGRPRTLSLETQSATNLHYLRTLDDASAIRAGFLAGQRLVIIGGGYVGLEVAASAISQGLKVTVLENRERLLARVTSTEMSDFYAKVHRDAGVDVRTGVDVNGFTFQGARVRAVECAGQESIGADMVVVGIGLLPNVELAQAAGLEVNDGIVVDAGSLTSDADIVAVGDCASFPIEACGRVRLESVPNALEQARCAAATLVGKQRAYQGVPWFWSDQYDLKLQMTGVSQGADQVVLRGDPEQRSFVAFYLKDGVLIACDAVNRPQDFMLAKRMVAAVQAFDVAALVDETVALKTLAPPLARPA